MALALAALAPVVAAQTPDPPDSPQPPDAGEPPMGEPMNREAPQLSRSDDVLSTSDGDWVGATEPFTYSWFRCEGTSEVSCDRIFGQTEDSYELVEADVGNRIRSRVTASNEAGSADAFSDPTDLIEGPEPPGETPAGTPPRMRPFPVVAIEGTRRGRLTRVTELVVRGPERVRVRARCRGGDRVCPFTRTGGRIGRRERLRLRRGQRTYRAGAVLEIRVRSSERIGKFTRIRFRGRGAIPARSDSCLVPGEREPVSCDEV